MLLYSTYDKRSWGEKNVVGVNHTHARTVAAVASVRLGLFIDFPS